MTAPTLMQKHLSGSVYKTAKDKEPAKIHSHIFLDAGCCYVTADSVKYFQTGYTSPFFRR